MVNLDVWLEANFCELELVSAAQCHRVDASYLAVPFSALLVSLHLACYRQLAHRLAPRRGAHRLCNRVGSDYRLGGRWIPYGLPPPLDSRCQNHDARGSVVYQRTLRLFRGEAGSRHRAPLGFPSLCCPAQLRVRAELLAGLDDVKRGVGNTRPC